MWNHVIPGFLQREQRLRCSNEYFRFPEFHVIREALLFHQHFHAILVGTGFEIRPGVLRYHFVS